MEEALELRRTLISSLATVRNLGGKGMRQLPSHTEKSDDATVYHSFDTSKIKKVCDCWHFLATLYLTAKHNLNNR